MPQARLRSAALTDRSSPCECPSVPKVSCLFAHACRWAFLSSAGYSKEQLLLELQLLDSTTRVPGQTLTGVEKRYRTQWISALDFVMQHVSDFHAPMQRLKAFVVSPMASHLWFYRVETVLS